MNHEKMLNLLLRPSWSAKEIQEYIKLTGGNMGITQATKIKRMLEIQGHQAPYRLTAVKVDAVMNYLGLDRKTEIKLLQGIVGDNNGSQN